MEASNNNENDCKSEETDHTGEEEGWTTVLACRSGGSDNKKSVSTAADSEHAEAPKKKKGKKRGGRLHCKIFCVVPLQLKYVLVQCCVCW